MLAQRAEKARPRLTLCKEKGLQDAMDSKLEAALLPLSSKQESAESSSRTEARSCRFTWSSKWLASTEDVSAVAAKKAPALRRTSALA